MANQAQSSSSSKSGLQVVLDRAEKLKDWKRAYDNSSIYRPTLFDGTNLNKGVSSLFDTTRVKVQDLVRKVDQLVAEIDPSSLGKAVKIVEDSASSATSGGAISTQKLREIENAFTEIERQVDLIEKASDAESRFRNASRQLSFLLNKNEKLNSPTDQEAVGIVTDGGRKALGTLIGYDFSVKSTDLINSYANRKDQLSEGEKNIEIARIANEIANDVYFNINQRQEVGLEDFIRGVSEALLTLQTEVQEVGKAGLATEMLMDNKNASLDGLFNFSPSQAGEQAKKKGSAVQRTEEELKKQLLDLKTNPNIKAVDFNLANEIVRSILTTEGLDSEEKKTLAKKISTNLTNLLTTLKSSLKSGNEALYSSSPKRGFVDTSFTSLNAPSVSEEERKKRIKLFYDTLFDNYSWAYPQSENKNQAALRKTYFDKYDLRRLVSENPPVQGTVLAKDAQHLRSYPYSVYVGGLIPYYVATAVQTLLPESVNRTENVLLSIEKQLGEIGKSTVLPLPLASKRIELGNEFKELPVNLPVAGGRRTVKILPQNADNTTQLPPQVATPPAALHTPSPSGRKTTAPPGSSTIPAAARPQPSTPVLTRSKGKGEQTQTQEILTQTAQILMDEFLRSISDQTDSAALRTFEFDNSIEDKVSDDKKRSGEKPLLKSELNSIRKAILDKFSELEFRDFLDTIEKSTSQLQKTEFQDQARTKTFQHGRERSFDSPFDQEQLTSLLSAIERSTPRVKLETLTQVGKGVVEELGKRIRSVGSLSDLEGIKKEVDGLAISQRQSSAAQRFVSEEQLQKLFTAIENRKKSLPDFDIPTNLPPPLNPLFAPIDPTAPALEDLNPEIKEVHFPSEASPLDVKPSSSGPPSGEQDVKNMLEIAFLVGRNYALDTVDPYAQKTTNNNAKGNKVWVNPQWKETFDVWWLAPKGAKSPSVIEIIDKGKQKDSLSFVVLQFLDAQIDKFDNSKNSLDIYDVYKLWDNVARSDLPVKNKEQDDRIDVTDETWYLARSSVKLASIVYTLLSNDSYVESYKAMIEKENAEGVLPSFAGINGEFDLLLAQQSTEDRSDESPLSVNVRRLRDINRITFPGVKKGWFGVRNLGETGGSNFPSVYSDLDKVEKLHSAVMVLYSEEFLVFKATRNPIRKNNFFERASTVAEKIRALLKTGKFPSGSMMNLMDTKDYREKLKTHRKETVETKSQSQLRSLIKEYIENSLLLFNFFKDESTHYAINVMRDIFKVSSATFVEHGSNLVFGDTKKPNPGFSLSLGDKEKTEVLTKEFGFKVPIPLALKTTSPNGIGTQGGGPVLREASSNSAKYFPVYKESFEGIVARNTGLKNTRATMVFTTSPQIVVFPASQQDENPVKGNIPVPIDSSSVAYTINKSISETTKDIYQGTSSLFYSSRTSAKSYVTQFANVISAEKTPRLSTAAIPNAYNDKTQDSLDTAASSWIAERNITKQKIYGIGTQFRDLLAERNKFEDVFADALTSRTIHQQLYTYPLFRIMFNENVTPTEYPAEYIRDSADGVFDGVSSDSLGSVQSGQGDPNQQKDEDTWTFWS